MQNMRDVEKASLTADFFCHLLEFAILCAPSSAQLILFSNRKLSKNNIHYFHNVPQHLKRPKHKLEQKQGKSIREKKQIKGLTCAVESFFAVESLIALGAMGCLA